MDKIAIKKFATIARKMLTASVRQKAEEIKLNIEQGDTWQDYVQEVGVTWFVRLITLKYMEVNGFLKEYFNNGTSKTLNKSQYFSVYKRLLTSPPAVLTNRFSDIFVNSENTIFPDTLLSEDGVLYQLGVLIPDKEWLGNVEIVGWLYQYFISEKKDKIFALLKDNVKVSKENIPAATQLFTPDWIVRYMTDNSLGRLGDSIKNAKPGIKCHNSESEYYIPEAAQPEDISEALEQSGYDNLVRTPEEIRVIDPCMGSGHILVYAFEVLMRIYLENGYAKEESAKLIVQKNLYGLDVDKTVAGLAQFAVLMTAAKYNSQLLYEDININIMAVTDFKCISDELIEKICGVSGQNHLVEDFIRLRGVFEDASEYGSLIKITDSGTDASKGQNCNKEDLLIDIGGLEKAVNSYLHIENVVEKHIEEGHIEEGHIEEGHIEKHHIEEGHIGKHIVVAQTGEKQSSGASSTNEKEFIARKLQDFVKQAKLLASKYHVCITNPPYMGRKSLNENIAKYIENKYPKGKSELYSAFMLRCMDFTVQGGYLSMITIHSWMFIATYEELRKQILDSQTIVSMVHTGAATFEELNTFNVLATAFVFRNIVTNGYKSTFLRLADYYSYEEKIRNFGNENNRYIIAQNILKSVPGAPFTYWISRKLRENFSRYRQLRTFAEPRQGLATGENRLFVRFWHEVDFDKIGFGCATEDEALSTGLRWFPYNKGGNFRKWYGMNEYVVNWENNGYAIKNHKNEKGKLKSRPQNTGFYFKSGITWSLFGFENFSVRYKENGFIFDVSGSSMFPEENDTYYILAFLASKVAFAYLSVLAPTVNFQVGNIGDLPLFIDEDIADDVTRLAKENIELSRQDWDSYETSWDFRENPLVRILKSETLKPETLKSEILKSEFLKSGTHTDGNDNRSSNPLVRAYMLWKQECEDRYIRLKSNEEIINQMFIGTYGLSAEMDVHVLDRDVTVHRVYDSKLQIPENMKDSAYVRTLKDEIKDFISYALGCMFGRYSLDTQGIAYAGGQWEALKSGKYNSFMPVKDNIIFLSEGAVENDFVVLFEKFVASVLAVTEHAVSDHESVTSVEHAVVEQGDIERAVKEHTDIDHAGVERAEVSTAASDHESATSADKLHECLDFIGNALGGNGDWKMALRDYMCGEFYEDHCHRYQGAPIYWMFTSGRKGGIKCLSYMHRLENATIDLLKDNYVTKILFDYKEKVKQTEAYLSGEDGSISKTERTRYKRSISSYNQKIEEIELYQEKLAKVCSERIAFATDDGVISNYEKIKTILAKII